MSYFVQWITAQADGEELSKVALYPPGNLELDKQPLREDAAKASQWENLPAHNFLACVGGSNEGRLSRTAEQNPELWLYSRSHHRITSPIHAVVAGSREIAVSAWP